MNPSVQKFGPPALVFGIALYLGWPPSEPMDLGDDLVRAKSVRWKPSDLESPQPDLAAVVDPFRPVLVAHKPVETARSVVAVDAPKAPSAGLVRSQLFLSGIAQMGKQRWAIINGKTHLAGDELTVDGKSVFVEAIQGDHVVIRSGDLKVQLKRSKTSGLSTQTKSSENHSGPSEGEPPRDQSWQTDRDSRNNAPTSSADASSGDQPPAKKAVSPDQFVLPTNDTEEKNSER